MENLAGFSSDEDDARLWQARKPGRKRDSSRISHSATGRERPKKRKARARSLSPRRVPSQNAMATMLKQHQIVPEVPINPLAHPSIPTNAIPVVSDGFARRPPIRHRESLGESTVTTTSTSNKYMVCDTTASGTTGGTEMIANVRLKHQESDVRGDEDQSMAVDDSRVQDPDLHGLHCLHPTTFSSARQRQKKKGRSASKSLHSCFKRRSFVMATETPFFALLEALEPEQCRDDHRRAILFPHACTTHDHTIPQAARILELPSISLLGSWVAELHQIDGSASIPVDEITTLRSSFLSLRHHSCPTISSLKSLQQGSMDSDTLAVSLIHPKLTRQTQIDLQRVCSAVKQNHKRGDDGFFISSISLVGFEGFTCSGDLNLNANKVSSAILKGLDDERSSLPNQAMCPALLGVSGASHPIGVSILCDLDMTCDYAIWIGQDLTMESSPIVAIDVVFSDTRNALTTQTNQTEVCISNSTTSSMSARDSTEEEAIQELSELNLRAHTQSVALTGYDPFERLWNHHGNTLNMRKLDATPNVKANLLPFSTKDNSCAPAVTLDPIPNASIASPNSLGPIHSPTQHPTGKGAITNPAEDRQPIQMNLSDDRMLVDGDAENLGRNAVLQTDQWLALQPTVFTDMEDSKPSLRPFSASQLGTEKKKSVADFFREHLSTSHSTNTLQRNTWEKSACLPNELKNKKESARSRPTGGVNTVQEKSKMLDIKETNAIRGRRPTVNSRSSLSMLVFATWSLLTWKTAIAPTGLWGASRNTLEFSSVSSLANLVWKPNIREEQSRIFPNPILREHDL